MLRVFDISDNTFNRSIRPYIPKRYIRKSKGGRLFFYGRGVLEAWAERRLPLPDATDPLLAGGTSQALEEYRRERAKLARLDRLEREGQLVRRSEIHEALALLAAHIRKAGERLGRRFGPDAQEILDEALNRFEQALEKLSSDDGSGEANHESADTASRSLGPD